MDPLTAGIISAGANTIGGLFQNQNSRANADHAFNQSLEASNTAHQREVTDLRAAGLNPILSALGSGASTPGATPSESSNLGEGISKGMDTAMAVKSMNKELQAKDATIGNLQADTDNKGAQRNLINAQAHQAHIDSQNKALQSELLQKTLPSMIKKAKAEGDWSEVNQIMGVISAGASSAADVLSIGNVFKGASKALDTKSMKLPPATFGKPFGK